METMSKNKRKKEKQITQGTEKGVLKDGWLVIDPERIRFQHSRLRPYFSGCGRGVVETLNEIRHGTLDPADLPPIQVRLMIFHDNQFL